MAKKKTPEKTCDDKLPISNNMVATAFIWGLKVATLSYSFFLKFLIVCNSMIFCFAKMILKIIFAILQIPIHFLYFFNSLLFQTIFMVILKQNHSNLLIFFFFGKSFSFACDSQMHSSPHNTFASRKTRSIGFLFATHTTTMLFSNS